MAAPDETLARVRPYAARMGITRLGNITGLDHIGIPVAVAVRPNSRSVSVSQGKGPELPQAMASALMEACEGFHAEEIGPCRRAAYRDLSRTETVVDPASLCAGGRPFDDGNTRSALSACRKHGQRVLLQRRVGRSERHTSRTRSRTEPSGQLHHLHCWPTRKRRFGSMRDGVVPERTSHCG